MKEEFIMKKRQLLAGLMAAMIALPGMAMAASTEDKADYKEKPGIHAEHKGPFAELDEEVRDALRDLKKQVIAGDITKAEFEEQMKELLPEGFELRARDKKEFREKRELTEEQKEFFEARKAYMDGEITIDELIEMAKEAHPEKEMDEETFKLRLEAKKQLVNGEITEEEFCEKLGLDYEKFQERKDALKGHRPHKKSKEAKQD
jgi:hypothetical protein